MRWGLEIATDVPAQTVNAVLTALVGAGLPEGYLVLRTPHELAPVRAPGVHRDLSASRDSVAEDQRLDWAARKLGEFDLRCPAITEGFEVVDKVGPEQACFALAGAVALAVGDCECRGEDAILTVMYALLLGSGPPANLVTGVHVVLSPEAPPHGGSTWAEVVAGIDPKDLGDFWVGGSRPER